MKCSTLHYEVQHSALTLHSLCTIPIVQFITYTRQLQPSLELIAEKGESVEFGEVDERRRWPGQLVAV